MSKGKPLGQSIDIQKTFHSEDGNHYRRIRSDEKAIKNHVRFLNHKVNEAPRSGNRTDWRYLGSMTWQHITDFLEEQGKRDGVFYDFNHFATNYAGIKDIFKKQVMDNNAFRDLKGDAGQTSVSVPRSIRAQAVDLDFGG